MNLYKLKNGSFVEISQDKIIYPRTYTFGIDGGQDESQITIINGDLYVDQLVRITHGTHSYDYVVSNKAVSNVSDDNKVIYTYKLVEPLTILQGYKLSACNLRANRYTLRNAIKRLCKLAKFDCEINLGNLSNEYLKVNIEFVSGNLYLALNEIGRVYDAIPYLEYNENVPYKKFVLKFQRTDGFGTTIKPISIFSNPVNIESITGEGLAKRVYCETTNLLIPTEFTEPSSSKKAVVSTDVGQLIDMDNVGIITNNVINKIDHIKLYGFDWQNNTGSSAPFVDNPVISTNSFNLHEGENSYYALNYNNGNWYSNLLGGLMIINKQVHFILKGEYDQLTQEQKDDYKIVYIPYDDVYVYLFDLPKLSTYESALGTKSTAQGICKNLTTVVALQTITNGLYFASTTGTDTYARIRLTKCYEQINYYGTIKRVIPFMAINNSEYDDTCYYNQPSKRLAPDRTARFLQTYIDNMESGLLSKEGVFFDFEDIPLEGTLIQDGTKFYIVNSVSIEEQLHYYKVTATLAPFHTKRRDYIEADTQLITTDPSSENLIDILYQSLCIFKISMFDSMEAKDDSRLSETASGQSGYECFLIPAHPILANKNFKHCKINNLVGYGLSYTHNFDENNPVIFQMGNNLIINEKALDNQNWNNGNPPQKYTSKEKEISYFYPYLKNKDSDLLFDCSEDFIDDTNLLVKDAQEVLNYTIQFAYKGINQTDIRQEYIERLFDTSQEPTYTLKLYDVNIGKYDSIPQEIQSIDLTYSGFKQSYEELRPGFLMLVKYLKWTYTPDTINSYRCVILFINSSPCIIKNYFNTQTTLPNSINVYVNSEDGLPFQKGIR